MDKLPPDFRQKYEHLRSVIDPLSQKSVADYLGDSYWGYSEYDNGARRFNFANGDISSYDHSNRYPIVCYYGPIFKFYDKVGVVTRSVLGRALTDVRDLPDGSRCVVFEGGHVHQWGDKASTFPANQCKAAYQPPPPPFPFDIGPNKVPLPFLYKWQELSFLRDPVLGTTLAEVLGAIDYPVANIDVGGQRLIFGGGEIIVYENRAFGVLPPIWKYWTGVDGGWGRPMTDEQELQDGGRCQVFEGGHIHRYADVAGPASPEKCTARYKPFPRPGVRFNAMPPFFQQKWSQLILVNIPTTGKPIALAMGNIDGQVRDWRSGKPGQTLTFGDGCMGTLSNDTNPPPPGTPLELSAPFVVYGSIYRFWRDKDASNSAYGRPLCDQQALPDGGRCNIFEGGHIHSYNEIAQDFPARQCQAAFQPEPPRAYPNRPDLQSTGPETYYPPNSPPAQDYSSGYDQSYSGNPQGYPQEYSGTPQGYSGSAQAYFGATQDYGSSQGYSGGGAQGYPGASQSYNAPQQQQSYASPPIQPPSQQPPMNYQQPYQSYQEPAPRPQANTTTGGTVVSAGIIALICGIIGFDIGDGQCCCCCC